VGVSWCVVIVVTRDFVDASLCGGGPLKPEEVDLDT
jgi:hypothetical protein